MSLLRSFSRKNNYVCIDDALSVGLQTKLLVTMIETKDEVMHALFNIKVAKVNNARTPMAQLISRKRKKIAGYLKERSIKGF